MYLIFARMTLIIILKMRQMNDSDRLIYKMRSIRKENLNFIDG
jgi:hypothetical protein